MSPQEEEQQEQNAKTALQQNGAVHDTNGEDEILHKKHKTSMKKKSKRHIYHTHHDNNNAPNKIKNKHSHKKLLLVTQDSNVNCEKGANEAIRKKKNSNNSKVNEINYFIQNEQYRVIGLGTVGLNASSVEPIHTLTMPCKQSHHHRQGKFACNGDLHHNGYTNEHNVNNSFSANTDHSENTKKVQIIPFYTPAFYKAEEPSYALRHATASDEEFKRWRERNLRHSLYHTYSLSPKENRELIKQNVNVLKTDNKNTNSTLNSIFNSASNNKNNNDNNFTKMNSTESDVDLEEKRTKAIAKIRAEKLHKKEQKIQEHELQLLTRRAEKKHGTPVDLPLGYYSVIVEQNRQLMPIPHAPRKDRFEYKGNSNSNNTSKDVEGNNNDGNSNNNTIKRSKVNSVIVYRNDIVSQFTPLPPDPSTLHKSVDLSSLTVKDHHKACQLAQINRQYVKGEIEEEKRADRQASMKVIREQLEQAQQEHDKQKEKWAALHESNSRSAFEAKHAQEHEAAQQLALQNKIDHEEWVHYAEEIKRKEAEEELAKRMFLRWQVFHERPNHTANNKNKETENNVFMGNEGSNNSESKELTEHAAICQKQHISHSQSPSPELKHEELNDDNKMNNNNNNNTFITTITPNAATTTNVYSELKKWIREDDMAQEAKKLALLHNLSGSRLPSRDGQRKDWLDTLCKDRTDFNAQTVRDFKSKYPELIYRSLNEHYNNKTHLASTIREIHSANVERMSEWQRDEDAYKSQLHRQQQRQEEKVNEVKTNYIAQLHHNAAATREEAKRNDELLHLIAEDEINALQMRVASARTTEHETTSF